MRWILFVGRLLFGGAFLWTATRQALHAQAATESLAAHSVPYPEVALAISTLLLALGGASVVLGIVPRIGLGLIVLELIASTLMYAADSGVELALFTKNIGLMGAALGLLSLPVPWPVSVDSWLRQRGGFSGTGPLVQSFRRLIEGARRAWVPKRARSLAHTHRVESSPNAWLVREQAVTRASGGIVMRSVRAYYFSG